MVCYDPQHGYRTPLGTITMNKKAGWADRPATRACGQCSGCRLENSRQWAMRIMHEASLYPNNMFLTLTYNPENLPENMSLEKRPWQLFMKKLKKKYKGKSIRFYQVGEYGDETHRPHYHAILFNHDFEDKLFLKYTELDQPLYTSEILDTVWGLGDCYIGDVTFESAAYCARYVMKKINGPMADNHYDGRMPEYSNPSRRPGIGKPWLDKWKTDVYPNDYVVMNGKRLKPPKYYDQKTKDEDGYIIKHSEPTEAFPNGFPVRFNDCKMTKSDLRTGLRARGAAKHSDNNTPERLKVREICHDERIKRLTRKEI